MMIEVSCKVIQNQKLAFLRILFSFIGMEIVSILITENRESNSLKGLNRRKMSTVLIWI